MLEKLRLGPTSLSHSIAAPVSANWWKALRLEGGRCTTQGLQHNADVKHTATGMGLANHSCKATATGMGYSILPVKLQPEGWVYPILPVKLQPEGWV